MNMTANSYNVTTNHHLSDVLSQIQDNGPAYVEPARQQRAHHSGSKKNARYSAENINKQEDNLYADVSPISLSGSQKKARRRAINLMGIKREISPGIWLQLLLLLISAALLATTLFKLNAQASNIENTLSIYDEEIEEKIQESADFQKKASSAGAIKMNAALQSLQNELQLIKTDYSTLDKKYVALPSGNALIEIKENLSTQEEISLFKTEILSLKNELQTVKNELEPRHPEEKLLAKKVVSSGLTVTLASLTNKSKAEEIVQQLYDEGLLPSIQQAVVKGERVYRLSVSGFLNRDEAELFIQKADEKYGMKNSRIRKS